jgi:hypothetical protein
VIHHPGNGDAHEHERMTTGRSLSVWSSQINNHFPAHTSENPDHEFHLPDPAQRVIAAAKKEAPSRSFFALATPQLVTVKSVSISPSPYPQLQPDPMLLSLRTVVLLV